MSDRDGTLGSGDVLEGRYELLEEIARGGFGMVFRARQLQMDREVAVKTLPPEFVESDEMVERFRREARFASQLSHPNTVTIHDYGKHETFLYLVMELLEGEDLADVLARERTVPLDRILPIARQVLKSLREAHEHNIVHRDLKPENIFLTEIGQNDEEVVKVLDFGIAKMAMTDASDQPSKSSKRRLTAEGTTMGTPIYMSPEQAAGDGVDHRTDLYALGIILYEMACGVPPFDHDESAVVMRRHIHADVPDFPDPELRNTWLEDVVQIALRKHRDERFENAGEFLEAIDEAVARSKGGYGTLHEDSDSVLERYESDETETSRHSTDSEETATSESGGDVVNQLEETRARDRQADFGNSSSIVTVLEEPGEPDDVVLLDEAKESSLQDEAPRGGGPDRPIEHDRGAPATIEPEGETEQPSSEPERASSSPERRTHPDAPSARGGDRNAKSPDPDPTEPAASASGGREREASSWSWEVDDEAPPDEHPSEQPEFQTGETWKRLVMTVLVLGLLAVAAFFIV
jgi:serine/threonine protein kinase